MTNSPSSRVSAVHGRLPVRPAAVGWILYNTVVEQMREGRPSAIITGGGRYPPVDFVAFECPSRARFMMALPQTGGGRDQVQNQTGALKVKKACEML